ncbi:MAG: condensation domain-containing protein, partial [Bacteroidota bacterium]
AVVVAKKGEAQESFLVAYYLSDRELDKAQLLAALEKNLPGYMIPPSLLPVEAFPLTPNKKVDRKKLAAMVLQNFASSDAFVPPQSLLEVQLSELWQSVLQINGPISIKDAFFSLGGHSLNAMRLIALIQERLGFVISLKTLFAHPDIESLASHLQQIVPQKPLAIDWVEERSYYPLTPAQQQLWLACQQGDQLIAYNMAAAYDLVGIPRLERMEAAIRRLIQQQDILRSNFVEIVGEAQQLVRPMKEIDFVIERDKRQPEEIEAVIEEFANRPFALEKDLLLRMKLLQYGEQRFCLLFCTHHLLMDGWSLERFVQDFIHVYQNRLAPETVEYVSRSLQFRDYAVHLHAQKAAKDQTASTGFWRKYLAAYATPYNLPVDHRVDTASAKGREIRFEIGAALLESLKQQASQYKVTLYALLAAAMKVVIHHRSAHMDICIACVHAGRNHPDLLPLYGSFAKTLPLRSQLMPEMSFVQLMQQVQEHLLSIDQHQDALPEGATVPVPDLLFVLQNPDHSLDAIVAMEDFSLHERPLEPHYSRLPMAINLIPKGDALEGRVSYQTDLYKTESIQLTIWMLEQVLATLAERPLASIAESKPTAAVESPADTQFEFNF